MTSAPTDTAKNLARIREGIERAAVRAGRKTEAITLVAVSKTHSAAQIRELYAAGVRHFGENRVQEWESKSDALKDLNATWHMIGHVQSNKAARAVRLFGTIDSVDSESLAERLSRAKNEWDAENAAAIEKNEPLTARTTAKRLPVLIEVKLDPTAAKSGVSHDDLPRLVEAVMILPHLDLRGLMGVPPYFDDAEKARAYFRHLRELRDSVDKQLGRELPTLSMGMSHDFEIAIEEGATEIRIGTALFGERPVAVHS